MDLHEILTERRRQIGMSMEELVDRSGVAKGTVSKIMAGITRNPQIESLKAITYALGLKLEDLDSDSISSSISPKARAFAEAFDKLDAHGQAVVSAVLDLERERCAATERDFDALFARQQEAMSKMEASSSTGGKMG